jgi:hypothetical protein
MKTTISIALFLVLSTASFSQNDKTEEAIKPEKQSVLLFKTLVYDFGTVEYGSEATSIFVFKNISKGPVTLTNVKPSCGCTTSDWPREPIARKKKGVIKLNYDTKRVGKFQKTAFVYTDKSENPIQLEIKGEVLPAKESEKVIETPQEQDGHQQKQINNGQNNVKVNSDGKVKSIDSKSADVKPIEINKAVRKTKVE